jgi:hypothetical protein
LAIAVQQSDNRCKTAGSNVLDQLVRLLAWTNNFSLSADPLG